MINKTNWYIYWISWTVSKNKLFLSFLYWKVDPQLKDLHITPEIILKCFKNNRIHGSLAKPRK